MGAIVSDRLATDLLTAALGGGVISATIRFFKDRKHEKRAREMGAEQIEVTAPAVAALQSQITAMTSAFDYERESWREQDRIKRGRIAELETELRDVTARLREAQTALNEVNDRVASLTARLMDLMDHKREE